MSEFKREKSKVEILAEKEVAIAKERAKKGYSDYVYDSDNLDIGLKVISSLCEDGHSGASIQMTKMLLFDMIDKLPESANVKNEEKTCKNDENESCNYGDCCMASARKALQVVAESNYDPIKIDEMKDIISRLIDWHPLTPIEDTDDIWSQSNMDSGYETYQCTRCSSLFKDVYPDGKVIYHDTKICSCVDINSPKVSYTSSLVTRLMHEMHPITMPFIPPVKRSNVYCDNFLTDENNGDFDTEALLYMVNENGEKEEINRFFKFEKDADIVEITKEEYEERKARKIR